MWRTAIGLARPNRLCVLAILCCCSHAGGFTKLVRVRSVACYCCLYVSVCTRKLSILTPSTLVPEIYAIGGTPMSKHARALPNDCYRNLGATNTNVSLCEKLCLYFTPCP